MGAIDLDRGVIIRQIVKFDTKNTHKFEPDEKYGGVVVHMYVDEPGVYYNVHGKKLPDAIAKYAGFDTDKLSKLRNKRLAVLAFEERVRAELEIELDEDEVVLGEAGEWKIIGLPMDRAKVVDKETGEMVTPVPLSRTDAKILLKELVAVNEDGKKNEVAKDKINGRSQA
jgi:hypothetical protein